MKKQRIAYLRKEILRTKSPILTETKSKADRALKLIKLQAELDELLNEKPLYVKEGFGDYDLPADLLIEVEFGRIDDLSWRHDANPSFGPKDFNADFPRQMYVCDPAHCECHEHGEAAHATTKYIVVIGEHLTRKFYSLDEALRLLLNPIRLLTVGDSPSCPNCTGYNAMLWNSSGDFTGLVCRDCNFAVPGGQYVIEMTNHQGLALYHDEVMRGSKWLRRDDHWKAMQKKRANS